MSDYVPAAGRPPTETFSTLIRAPFEEDRARTEEVWTRTTEKLIVGWAKGWTKASDAHAAAGRKKRFLNNVFQVPMTLIPLALTPLTSTSLLEATHFVVVGGLVLVACLSSFQTVMRFDAAAEKHDSSSWRYLDLISDVEEVLSKRTYNRPDPDMFVSKIKTRSEFVARFAPDVVIEEDSDDDLESDNEDRQGEGV